MHFGHGQFAVTGAYAKLVDLLFDLRERHLVGVAHHGDDEARRRTDRNTHVDEVLVDHIGAVDFGVDLGHLFQGVRTGLGEEGHEAELHAVFLLEQFLVFLAKRHRRGHVDLVVGRQHRGGVLCIFQAARDGLAQTCHLHTFFAASVFGWDRCAGRSGSRRSRSLWRWAGERLLHVFLHDATIAARAGDSIGRKVVFGHEFFGRWRVFNVFAAACWSGCGFGRFGCSGGCCCSAFARGHHSELAAGFYGCAFCGENLGQNAGCWRRNLD